MIFFLQKPALGDRFDDDDNNNDDEDEAEETALKKRSEGIGELPREEPGLPAC